MATNPDDVFLPPRARGRLEHEVHVRPEGGRFGRVTMFGDDGVGFNIVIGMNELAIAFLLFDIPADQRDAVRAKYVRNGRLVRKDDPTGKVWFRVVVHG